MVCESFLTDVGASLLTRTGSAEEKNSYGIRYHKHIKSTFLNPRMAGQSEISPARSRGSWLAGWHKLFSF